MKLHEFLEFIKVHGRIPRRLDRVLHSVQKQLDDPEFIKKVQLNSFQIDFSPIITVLEEALNGKSERLLQQAAVLGRAS